jgi:toxin ParE1/3/4
MRRVSLSKAAAADLDEIDNYTLESFGLGQAVRIRRQFQETFRALVEAPLSAPRRKEYDPPGRAFRYFPALKRFIIVYEPVDKGIRVARVLHGARDLAKELEREAGRE